MRKAIKIGNELYAEDRYGVIHQLKPQPFTYDPRYSATYDTPEYERRSELLQAMRFAFASAVHGKPIQSLTDVGYGNGAFMRFAKKQVPVVYGHDITGVEVPLGCDFTADINMVCDVITFHDVLEHFPTLGFVKHLKAETLIVSLPFFPGVEGFPSWCHRKPDEHLHHFTDESLRRFMWKQGWRLVSKSKHEDIVRRRDVDWNILSCGFKRK
jgi:hypothetical protein